MKAPIHFLHIRKTGGNAIKEALRLVPGIVIHPHRVTLADIPEGERVFFALRDPVDRFVSGFNSRRRCGRPKLNSPWNDDERAALTRFPRANDLALALSSTADARRGVAEAAMAGINHVNSTYADWLSSTAYLDRRRADIVWVGLTSQLATDFEGLKQTLDLPPTCVLPSDPVIAHRRLPTDEVHLSPEARQNIERWYAADYQFLAYFFPGDNR